MLAVTKLMYIQKLVFSGSDVVAYYTFAVVCGSLFLALSFSNNCFLHNIISITIYICLLFWYNKTACNYYSQRVTQLK